MKVTMEEEGTKGRERVAVDMGSPVVAGEGCSGGTEDNGDIGDAGGEEEEEEEEEEVEKKEKEEDEEDKWAKHYSSGQEILLVGEGDFSFSLSLATSFGSAANIVATSLDSYSEVTRKYGEAKSNLGCLKKMGATLLHGIDATKMKLHTNLKMRKFDRIIFNFPHAGFKGKEDDMRLINLHKKLVCGFFRSASRMLREDGEVHISHKTSFPFSYWKLEELASKNSLVLLKCAYFKIEDYPGYNNKRGDGARCDLPFPLGECCTFMFIIGKPPRRKRRAKSEANLGGMLSSAALPERGPNCVPIAADGYLPVGPRRPLNLVPNHCGIVACAGLSERNPNPFPIASDGYPFLRTEGPYNRVPNLHGILPYAGQPERNPYSVPLAPDGHLLHRTQRPPTSGYMRYVNGWPNMEGFPGSILPHSRPQQLGYISDQEERTGSSRMVVYGSHGGCPQNAITGPEFISAAEVALRRGFEVYMNETPGRTPHGYIAHLQELHRSSIQRTEWLKRMLLLRQAP